jgi:hypothetical protein
MKNFIGTAVLFVFSALVLLLLFICPAMAIMIMFGTSVYSKVAAIVISFAWLIWLDLVTDNLEEKSV